MSATLKNVRCWTCSKIPYVIQSGHPGQSKIIDAMNEIQGKTPIWFTSKLSETFFINIVYDPNNGNYSSTIGMPSTPHTNGYTVNVNNADGYWATHELCHVAGLIHEEERSDRDSFVHLDNPGDHNNAIQDSDNLTAYDRWSIMQYAKDMGGGMYWLADPTGGLGASNPRILDTQDQIGLQALYADNSGWQNLTCVVDAGTVATPALCAFPDSGSGSLLYAGWLISDNDELKYGSYDAQPQSVWSILGRLGTGGSRSGPALASYNNAMWASWAGSGGNGIFYCTFQNGSWSGQSSIPGGTNTNTSQAPAMAEFQGLLWFAYAYGGSLYYSTYNKTNGQWAGPTKLDGAGSELAPSLAVFGGRLYAAWKGYGSDNHMYYSSNDGTGWVGQTGLPVGGTKAGPALGVYRNPYAPTSDALYIVWTGSGDTGLWWAYFDGTQWSGQARMNSVASNGPPAANSGPSLARFDDRLYCAWQGVNETSIFVNYLYIPQDVPKPESQMSRERFCDIP